MDIVTYAGEYFSTHLEKSFWTGLDATKQQACLNMATADVIAKLGIPTLNLTSRPQMNAVCEQAVFLARHHERLNLPFEVISEDLDGVGSRTYNLRAVPEISRRALMFIRQAAGGGNTLFRG